MIEPLAMAIFFSLLRIFGTVMVLAAFLGETSC